MTEEELKQKAIENVRNRFSICKNRNDDFILDNFGAEVEALVQFAQSQLTEKDKQIQIDKGCAEVWENLTKAKDIIKTFLGFAEAFGYSPSMDKFISEAEQFLNGVEVNGI